tara:strand:+ start:2085 stop:2294 length:210 start_codon:yes stop_codon:yes gene_type:complete
MNTDIYWPDWIPKVGDLVQLKSTFGRVGTVVNNNLSADGNPTDEVDVYFFTKGEKELVFVQDLEIISRA